MQETNILRNSVASRMRDVLDKHKEIDKIWSELNKRITHPINNQLRNQVRHQVSSPVRNQLRNNL